MGVHTIKLCSKVIRQGDSVLLPVPSSPGLQKINKLKTRKKKKKKIYIFYGFLNETIYVLEVFYSFVIFMNKVFFLINLCFTIVQNDIKYHFNLF